jgi:glucosamine 6-phosphate synthetase-like amidotransferase/phosphosugar isomerase protein
VGHGPGPLDGRVALGFDVNVEGFRRDLEAKPASLRALAAELETGSPWGAVPASAHRFVFVGMGSSRYAASVVAARLRALGVDAVAEYASAASASPGGRGTFAVGISASGGTEETVAALRRHRDAGSAAIAMTNVPGSAISVAGTSVVDLRAGEETGGVACRTFQHTLALLLALEDRIADRPGDRVPGLLRQVADASEALLSSSGTWLGPAAELVGGGGQAFVIGPEERLSSADQGALMLREGPRFPATACETGEWLHVDVYLTKSLDYRGVLFAGSRFDDQVMGWVRERSASILAVGGDRPDARLTVRYPGDGDPDVALLSEILVPELIAAELWRRST